MRSESTAMAKLNDQARDEVLKLLARGQSQRAVAEWVKRHYGVSISQPAIAKIAKSARTVRADVAKVVIRDKVAGALTGDLDVLEQQVRRLKRLTGKAFKHALKYPRESQSFLNISRELRETIEQRIKRSGADEPDEPLLGLVDWLGQALNASRTEEESDP